MFITNVLAQHAKNQPNELAIVFEGNKWTYSELYENAKKLLGTCKNRAIKKGIL